MPSASPCATYPRIHPLPALIPRTAPPSPLQVGVAALSQVLPTSQWRLPLPFPAPPPPLQVGIAALSQVLPTSQWRLPLPFPAPPPPLQVGIAALSQVLPTSVLRTLSLNTNSVGDDGAESLSKVLSGGCVWEGMFVWECRFARWR